jgi:hypothetical protein
MGRPATDMNTLLDPSATFAERLESFAGQPRFF